MIGPAIKAFSSLRSRQLLTLHNGSNDELLESLAACSLPPTAVPTCMGGSLHVSLEDLFKARLAIEAARDNNVMSVSEVNHKMSHMTVHEMLGVSTNQDGNISDVSMTSDSKPSFLPPRSSSSTNQTARFGLLGGISDVSRMMTDQQSDTTMPNSSKRSSASSDSKPQKNSSKHWTAKVEERGKIRKNPGRSGDERMHKAVDARRRNPEISLLDALLGK